MQLNIDVSPPANIMTFRLGLTHVTFDLNHVILEPCDPLIHYIAWKTIREMFFDLVTLSFKVDLNVVYVHALTKFHNPTWNILRDMN